MTGRVVDELRRHLLPGPLPLVDLSLPDDQVPYAELAAWLQSEQLWRLIVDLGQTPDPTPRIGRIRLQRIFHAQDKDLRTRAQHACLATVTRYTLTLIDHAETSTTPPQPTERYPRPPKRQADLHGTRAIWAERPDPPSTNTTEAERITRRIDEIRKRIRDQRHNEE